MKGLAAAVAAAILALLAATVAAVDEGVGVSENSGTAMPQRLSSCDMDRGDI